MELPFFVIIQRGDKMAIKIQITDHSEEFLRVFDDRVVVALEEVGLAAEGFAKRLCTVDTGLLRNSITHALDGEPVATPEYQDNPGKQFGRYDGTAPKEGGKNRAVFIGTNVEYAPYVELGTSKQKAQPFLKPAVVNNVSKFKKIFESHFK